MMRRIESRIMVMTILLPATLAAHAGDGQTTTQSVLDAYVDALGGRAALEALDVRHCEGVFVDDRPYRGPATTSSCRIRAAAGQACEIVMDGAARIDGSGTDGERGKLSWLLDPRGALTVARDFPNLRYDGDRRLDGRFVSTLVSDRDPDHYALHFDTATGLLVRIGHYWSIGDYREVDGVRVPHRIDCSRKGGSNTWILERVAHEGR